MKIINLVPKTWQTSDKQVMVPVCTLRGARTALVNYTPPDKSGKTHLMRRCGKHHRNPPPQISAAASLFVRAQHLCAPFAQASEPKCHCVHTTAHPSLPGLPRSLFGSSSISVADANKETPATARPPYKLPVF